MKRFSPISSNFIATYSQISQNSLQFENICNTEPVAKNSDSSRYNLQMWECELLTTYLPSIIDNAKMVQFLNKKRAQKYYYNPQRLSMDNFGVSDYWFLILAMNNYRSRFEFKDFENMLFIPDVNYVGQIITDLEKLMVGVSTIL